METMDKYDCSFCANKSAVVCGQCTYVVVPGGEEKRPSWFCDARKAFPSDEGELGKMIDRMSDEEKAEFVPILKELIEATDKGSALPLRTVLSFNRMVDKYGEEPPKAARL